MKQYSLLVALICLSALASARVHHVSPTGAKAERGRSWSAATTLAAALQRAKAGDEIWLRTGLYRTTAGTDRTRTFTIPAGVHVYGGFSGRELHLRQRPKNQYSTLSGDIGRTGYAPDNAFTVVTLRSEPRLSSLLDGLAIQGGMGRDFGPHHTARNAGGGLYVSPGGGPRTNHQIRNCLFRNNRAHNGGGAYIDGGAPTFSNCQFLMNTADFRGGGVYTDGTRTEAAPLFLSCVFRDNAGNAGGGLANDATAGVANPSIIGCTFTANVSRINGAAIFNMRRNGGTCEPVIEDCRYTGNASNIDEDVAELGRSEANTPLLRKDVRGGTLRPVSAKRR